MADPPNSGAFDPIKVSKLLAFLLRHRPDTVGLTLETEGWVSIAELVREINTRQRLPFPLEDGQIATVVAESGNGRFEVRDGKVRARSGHSVPGIRIPREPSELDDFAFAVLTEGEREAIVEGGALPAGRTLSLEEPLIPDEQVLVVEVARANRQGIPFSLEGDTLTPTDAVPIKYLLSLRPGFTRQISAGGVLMRGQEANVEFALIRTRPRKETRRMMLEDLGLGSDEEPREKPDRRQEDRRRSESSAPPTGVERRKSSGRRRRQRRSGRWGPDGRLELPKGKLELGETPAQAAVREVREELGFDDRVEVIERLASNRYAFRTPEGKAIFKTVHYFLLRCDNPTPDFNPALAEGIVGVEWIRGRDAISEVAFPNLRPILERAWELVHLKGA